ncbi:MAG TPA: hypothetical protein VH988_13080 [Thermoanaerobaculia bacterium]|jgi:hypothetical protein|nr:hypothetical protein [Thermoanaerobaculia bacterium]
MAGASILAEPDVETKGIFVETQRKNAEKPAAYVEKPKKFSAPLAWTWMLQRREAEKLKTKAEKSATNAENL